MGLSGALVVCTMNGTGALSGAQTERRGGAGPAGGLLRGKDRFAANPAFAPLTLPRVLANCLVNGVGRAQEGIFLRLGE
jgi:hypothetical protein